MTTPVETATLALPGARLYYERRGAGPLLLIIPGGPQDAGVFADLADRLANRYTVVTIDPRGNSRSTIDSEPGELDVGRHADDVAALIAHLGLGPAHVFGTSGGAQIGLDLAGRHPERVATLVAHEPPTMMLLEHPDADIAEANGLYDLYRAEGVEAAMAAFFGANALDEDGPPEMELPPEAAETMGRVMGNFEYWLAHGLRPLSFYTPDVGALKAGKPRIVVAIGRESQGQPIARMAGALAERLGLSPTIVPGDHVSGFDRDVEAFAAALHGALTR